MCKFHDSKLLLNLAQSIFEEQTSLERLVSKIMIEAQGLLKCEQSLVYLRDVPLYEAVSLKTTFKCQLLNDEDCPAKSAFQSFN